MKKFKSNLDKLINRGNLGEELEIGFHDPKVWIHTGNYALNKIISGDFLQGFPMGKTMILAGEPQAGKSYMACSIMKNAQAQGILPIVLDSESALDRGFLERAGVDTSEDKLLYYGVTTVSHCQSLISKVLKGINEIPEEDRTPILFIIDSLGMLLTEKEQKEFDTGVMKADMGSKAKQLRLFFRMITNQIAKYEAGVIATNHTYKGSDMYGNPKTSISGGDGLIYAASIVLMLSKKELKDKSLGAKAPTDGIYVKTRCLKTRFSQPFQRVDMELPYKGGLDPYSGLLDQFVASGIVSQNKGWYTLVSTGEKFQRKDFPNFADDLLKQNPDVISDSTEDDGVDGISATGAQLLNE
jgi:RecA/RadA recombinase